ncbi:hypothetical protein DENSPDRAFT_884196 [Dentipellis sp. KUC8613]|nr:hypothetical protein DENSPDRAFT_884196 [Dentipellis sp. KUC8613]
MVAAAKAKKGLKIGRNALMSAARLPARVSGGLGSGRNNFTPIQGEVPIVILRVQVLGCCDLLAKDRGGSSDPFVVVSVLSRRQQTPVVKRSTNPVYAAKDATFDFPIYLSLADKLGVVELVVWDKDMLKKDYLGEAALPLEDWFKDSKYAFDDPGNEPFSVPLVSTRGNTNATGTLRLKLGFVNPPNVNNLAEFDETYNELVKRSRPSLVSAPPTEGVGTIRSHQTGPAFEDDGFDSDEGEGDMTDDDEYFPPTSASPSPPSPPKIDTSTTIVAPMPRSASPETTPTLAPKIPININPPTPVSKPPSPSTGFSIPKIFPRRPSLPMSSNSYDSTLVGSTSASVPTSASASASGSSTPSAVSSPPVLTTHSRSASTGASTPTATRKKRLRKSWGAGNKKGDFDFNAANDIVGIVMLEIHGATDLPKLRNMTRTGWDMDPFVVISFGKKVFRTRVVRHSLNPVWDEKLLFHVRRYETAFKAQLTVLDWDKLSSNDHVGDASFEVAQLSANVPKKDPQTGLYPKEDDNTRSFQEFTVPLRTAKEMPWESKHHPTITFRAKYQPYDALRQRFWYQFLEQYDSDNTGSLSHLELTSMLDSLGSTLSRQTISSFFTRWGKKPSEDEITYEEAIQCLETEICRPQSEKRRIPPGDAAGDTSTAATPSAGALGAHTPLALDQLDFSGPALSMPEPAAPRQPYKPAPPAPYPTEPMQVPLPSGADAQVLPEHAHALDAIASEKELPPRAPGILQQQASTSSSDAEDSSGSGSGSGDSGSDDSFERVINVKSCPLCHRPRMNSKAERDIVTHLAVCASQDWARVDRIMVGNFVTASQAQRKWYTKVISKVSAGNYKLGANSANIIVQNRITGQLEEEKMQVYVRLGIRLLYKGARGKMEGARARRLLKSLSIKQGIKYDSPESAQDIPSFIQFHKLNVDEIRDPISSFKTFNEFFYRKLKPEARPVEEPDNGERLVSAADCRLMAFESVSEATRLWIKGREFTVARLLGDAYKGQAERYNGGALAIFRLAPQDYHRFHSPVDGTIGPMTDISGEYYTVNPQAIRTTLDVYGENVRKIVPIDSPHFGRVMAVCVGAMMVGSIKTTVAEGEQVKRGQEFGYFAFGGSTIVVLFEKGVVEWDEDLLINGRASLETLVRVGMGIGRRA